MAALDGGRTVEGGDKDPGGLNDAGTGRAGRTFACDGTAVGGIGRLIDGGVIAPPGGYEAIAGLACCGILAGG